MSDDAKTDAKVQQVTGKVKETAGHAVGNEEMEAEGRGEQAEGNLRQAGQKAKDAAKDVFKH